MAEYSNVTLTPVSSAFGGEDPDRTVVYGYMCNTDWEYELGMASDGNRVFPSIEDLREHYNCVDSCGIVKVAIVAIEQITEPNWDID